MLEIFYGALDTPKLLTRWYNEYKTQNFGAMVEFIGIVRDEGIDGLSFDIYEPLLNKWFANWSAKCEKKGAHLIMAHSKGFVPKHETSYIACVLSPKRRVALETIDEFVEDFKANAPIWKYDVVNGEKIYAKERSKALPQAGLLG